MLPLGCPRTIEGITGSTLSINYSPVRVVLQIVNLEEALLSTKELLCVPRWNYLKDLGSPR